jgi:hypothetical protein
MPGVPETARILKAGNRLAGNRSNTEGVDAKRPRFASRFA